MKTADQTSYKCKKSQLTYYMTSTTGKQIFVALDNQSATEIRELVQEFKGDLMFKVNDAFTKHGPQIVKEIRDLGGEVFLDLKWHDIPNTVANYVRTAADLGVFCCTIHCLGGFEMMQAAAESLNSYCTEQGITPRPKLLGITVLTSMTDQSLRNDLLMSGPNQKVNDMVRHLATKAKEAGLDGVVCSPLEIEIVKKACGADFITVTPGIRPSWACSDDQKRILTPKQAVEKGTDYLVIGRPIIQAHKYGLTRKEAVSRIQREIEEGQNLDEDESRDDESCKDENCGYHSLSEDSYGDDD